MAQYIHLLTNNHIGLPTDMWLPVSNNIRPLLAKQVALGIAGSIRDKQVEFSIEAYSKTLDNLRAYQDDTNFLSPINEEQDVMTIGSGNSRGLELFIQKKHGETSGLIGYNLSWTNKKFAAYTFGKEFPHRYDRRHNISFAVSHNFTPQIEFSANWLYGTGDLLSLPAVKYVKTVLPIYRDLVEDEVIYINEAKQNFRIRAYHRMDVTLRLYKQRGDSEQILTISFYNLYSRKNPYFIHFDDSSREKLAIKQVSLFPVIPFISYSFTF